MNWPTSYRVYSEREENFTECFKINIIKIFEDNLVCQSAAIQGLNLSSKTPVCSDKMTSLNATKFVYDGVLNKMKNLDDFKCPLPCTYSTYSVDLVRQHKNAIMLFGKESDSNDLILYFYYANLETVVESESLRIDFSTLMSNIGGNLGLFLGFSCLTIYLFILEFVNNRMK